LTLSAWFTKEPVLNRYQVLAGDTLHPVMLDDSPPLTISSWELQARQHVVALHVAPGVQAVLKLSLWLGSAHVTFWLAHVAMVPTHTPPKHRSLIVPSLKSVHTDPLAE
jgi:hypothetical protein